MSDSHALQARAQHATEQLKRVASFAEGFAGGISLDEPVAEPVEFVARLEAAGEAARQARSDTTGDARDRAIQDQWRGVLPLNRKERFYTGTVFPGIVASSDFWHLQRCLDLFGLPAEVEVGEQARVQLITEYGFAESVITEEDRRTWGSDLGRETPDIVIAGPGWLLAIEAKVFHNPSAADLNGQMAAQSPIVDRWAQVLGLPESHVVHALLLPKRLADRHQGQTLYPVVTWEALLDAYWAVAPKYWLSVLAEALERHEILESTGSAFDPNADGSATGQEIYDGWKLGSPSFPYTHMGRRNGLSGAELAGDLADGSWQTRTYQVRLEAIEAKNWLPISSFVDLIELGQ